MCHRDADTPKILAMMNHALPISRIQILSRYDHNYLLF